MKTFLIGFSEEEIVNKAEEIIAEELEEKNRKSRFCYTPTEIAKLYNMSGNDLNSFLKDQGIIRKQEGAWCLTRKYIHRDLARHRYIAKTNQKGQLIFKAKLVWTDKGKEFIKQLIKY